MIIHTQIRAFILRPLTKGVGPALSGIYALYFNDKVVHIGAS